MGGTQSKEQGEQQQQQQQKPQGLSGSGNGDSEQQQRPVQFGRSLLNQLDKTSLENGPDSARQSKLDESVRKRIKSELDRLRAQEASVRGEIEKALEKENLDREKASAGKEGEGAAHRNSVILKQDLEEVRKKIERHHEKRELQNYPDVKAAQESLIACYRSQPQRTLDCWKETENFKAAVARAEKDFIASWS